MLRGALTGIAWGALVGACGRLGFDEARAGIDAADSADADLPFVEPAGVLDPTFGTGGYTTTASSSVDHDLHGVLSRAGGYLVIGVDGTTTGTSHFGLFGFTLAGQVDPSFGAGGIVDVGPTSADYGYGLARLGPDRIAVTGDGNDNGITNDDITTGIVDLTGATDPTFGTAGFIRLDAAGADKEDTSNAVAVVDDTLVVCGAANYAGVNSRFVLARYDLAGALVPSWGTGGVVLDDFQTGVQDECISVVARPSGGVYAVGRSGQAVVIAAYDATGQRDLAFGGAGFRLVANGTGAYAYGVAVAGTDVVAVGESNGLSIVIRIDAAGNQVAGFGTGGIASLANVDLLNAVVVQPNGKLLVAGLVGDAAVVARMLADGSPDPAFATAGVFTLAINPGTQFAGLLLDPAAGQIVAVGTTNAATPLAGVIARLR